MKAQDYKISSELFTFHKTDGNIHDTKLETRPMSYLQDAFHRFSRNKASILAAFIIVFLVLFAIFGPMLTPYSVSYEDVNYSVVLPKIKFFYDNGIEFWDGGKNLVQSEAYYMEKLAIQTETGRPVFIGDVEKMEEK
jgi:ABC-type dipeptide/oligopeptide/nickel transport system permease subunit